jgi:hypothetical protein
MTTSAGTATLHHPVIACAGSINDRLIKFAINGRLGLSRA